MDTLIPDLPDLSTLSATANSINEHYKEINKRLLEFESQLRGLNLDVEGWVTDVPLEISSCEGVSWPTLTKDQNRETIEKRYLLGFCEAKNGRFRLFCKVVSTIAHEGTKFPLLEASMNLRIKALGKMGELVRVLEVAAKEKQAELKKKLEMVEL